MYCTSVSFSMNFKFRHIYLSIYLSIYEQKFTIRTYAGVGLSIEWWHVALIQQQNHSSQLIVHSHQGNDPTGSRQTTAHRARPPTITCHLPLTIWYDQARSTTAADRQQNYTAASLKHTRLAGDSGTLQSLILHRSVRSYVSTATADRLNSSIRC